MDERTRRGFLTSVGVGSALTAGCLGSGGGSEGTNGGTDTATVMKQGSGDVTFDHSSATAINDQPTLGDREWQGVIVAFEDPSCPTCRRFNQNTFPRVRSDLVATGDVAYVLRGYPVVYPWGEPASHALEATFDRDPAAMWALKRHYFDQQGQFSMDNVLDRTATFLNGNTEVDGDAVVADVESDAYADAVQVDLDAGEAAGASGTPTFYLFRDGEYQTTVSGAQDYTVFENVLTG